MAPSVPAFKLNSGYSVPALGLGTWKSTPGQVTQAVKDAIDAGYRHIDGAHVYQNEPEVGAGIHAKIQEGVVKREDLFVVSKLWNTYHNPAVVEKACRRTLSDLKLEYLDLYLIHWPFAYIESDEIFPRNPDGSMKLAEIDYVDTWKAMEKLVEKGLVRSIGISNFNKKQIERVLAAATIKPATNQVECHPYLPQKKLSEFCKSHGILITAYSPLASPDRPVIRDDQPVLLEDPRVKAIADKYKKSTAQVLLRYQIDRGHIAIPKSVSKQRIVENIDLSDFQLSGEDLEALNALDLGKKGRYCTMEGLGENAKEYPFTAEW